MSLAPSLAAAATLTSELGLPLTASSQASSHAPSRLGRQQPSYRHAPRLTQSPSLNGSGSSQVAQKLAEEADVLTICPGRTYHDVSC